MANYFVDNCTSPTGATLHSRGPATGTSWTRRNGATADWVVRTDGAGARPDTGGGTEDYVSADATYSSANYRVTHNLHISNLAEYAGTLVHLDVATGNGYVVAYNTVSGLLQTQKVTSWARTLLHGQTFGWTSGNNYAISIDVTVSGSNVTIATTIGGTLVDTVTDSTAAYTAAGVAGLWYFQTAAPSDGNAHYVNTFVAASIPVPTFGIAPTTVNYSSSTTVTASGTNTAWNGSTTFTSTAGATLSAYNYTNIGSQQISFTYVAPSSGSTDTIGDTVDAATATMTLTAGSSPATGYSLSGPSSGVVSVASTNFTVTLTPSGGTSSGVVITPHTNLSGTFAPTTVTLSTGTPSATFTFTPSVTGAHTISGTNNSTLTNPGTLTYTVSNAPPTLSVTAPANLTRNPTGQTAVATTVTFGGTNNSWLTTPPVFSVSAGGNFGASIGSPSVSTNNACTAPVIPGTMPATLTITDTTTSKTTTIAVVSAQADTVFMVGDSMVQGSYFATPFATGAGLTVDHTTAAQSGFTPEELGYLVLGLTQLGTSLRLYQAGLNSSRFYSNWSAALAANVLPAWVGSLAYLGMTSAGVVLANAAPATKVGTWVAVGGNFANALKTATTGTPQTITVVVTGKSVYVGYLLNGGSPRGTFTFTIDGAQASSNGIATFNCATAVAPPNQASGNSTPLGDFLAGVQISGLSAGSHTVVITADATVGPVPIAYIGAGGSAGPTVLVGSLPHIVDYAGNSPYNLGTDARIDLGNSRLLDLINRLRGDGLDIRFVNHDLHYGPNAATVAAYIGGDNVHPSTTVNSGTVPALSGSQVMANAYLFPYFQDKALIGGSIPSRPGSGIIRRGR